MVVTSGKARGGELRPRVLKVSRAVAHLWTVCDSVVSGGWLRLWHCLVGLFGAVKVNV